MCLKPQQVKSLEAVHENKDGIAVLPTGFGKSLIFQLLPSFITVKTKRNIVIVVCPLTSIIQDQINVLSGMGLTPGILRHLEAEEPMPSVFENISLAEEVKFKTDQQISCGEIDILFAHPEALLCDIGGNLSSWLIVVLVLFRTLLAIQTLINVQFT